MLLPLMWVKNASVSLGTTAIVGQGSVLGPGPQRGTVHFITQIMSMWQALRNAGCTVELLRHSHMTHAIYSCRTLQSGFVNQPCLVRAVAQLHDASSNQVQPGMLKS